MDATDANLAVLLTTGGLGTLICNIILAIAAKVKFPKKLIPLVAPVLGVLLGVAYTKLTGGCGLEGAALGVVAGTSSTWLHEFIKKFKDVNLGNV